MNHRHASALLLLCGLVLSTNVAAQSQESQARCQVTGPLVISAYTAFLREAGQKKPSAAAEQAQNVASLLALYDGLGCPVAALQNAIECLTTKLIEASSSSQPVTTSDAETCMQEAGMPVR